MYSRAKTKHQLPKPSFKLKPPCSICREFVVDLNNKQCTTYNSAQQIHTNRIRGGVWALTPKFRSVCREHLRLFFCWPQIWQLQRTHRYCVSSVRYTAAYTRWYLDFWSCPSHLWVAREKTTGELATATREAAPLERRQLRTVCLWHENGTAIRRLSRPDTCHCQAAALSRYT